MLLNRILLTYFALSVSDQPGVSIQQTDTRRAAIKVGSQYLHVYTCIHTWNCTLLWYMHVMSTRCTVAFVHIMGLRYYERECLVVHCSSV